MGIKDLTEVTQTEFDSFLLGTSFSESEQDICGRTITEYSDTELQAVKSIDNIELITLFYINQ